MFFFEEGGFSIEGWSFGSSDSVEESPVCFLRKVSKERRRILAFVTPDLEENLLKSESRCLNSSWNSSFTKTLVLL